MLRLFGSARRWSAGVRAALGVLGLIGPLALVSLVPLDVLPYLDGLFLGAVWGLLLWLAIAIFPVVAVSFRLVAEPARETGGVAYLRNGTRVEFPESMCDRASTQKTASG